VSVRIREALSSAAAAPPAGSTTRVASTTSGTVAPSTSLSRVPAVWTCPACLRTFGRSGQGHECAPALSLEEYFATGPERERPVFDAVWAHLDDLGDVRVEPVSVGILFKRRRTFAELRPRTRWVDLGLTLQRRVEHPYVTRYATSQNRVLTQHGIRLVTPADVDDQVRDWLTEAWDAAEPD
jgi:hypothetical protein